MKYEQRHNSMSMSRDERAALFGWSYANQPVPGSASRRGICI